MYQTTAVLVVIVAVALVFSGCKRAEESERTASETETKTAMPKSAHTHEDGSTHEDHDEAEHTGGEDHAHDEVSLGTVTIGDMDVKLAQGHGKVEAGKESHLVVKLPYNDHGATIVRAWLGTEDRLRSVVGKGEYAPSHDDYDIHATAPTRLPQDVRWWIEIQKPDGSKALGSARPLMD